MSAAIALRANNDKTTTKANASFFKMNLLKRVKPLLTISQHLRRRNRGTYSYRQPPYLTCSPDRSVIMDRPRPVKPVACRLLRQWGLNNLACPLEICGRDHEGNLAGNIGLLQQ